jgi:hypothetical protein
MSRVVPTRATGDRPRSSVLAALALALLAAASGACFDQGPERARRARTTDISLTPDTLHVRNRVPDRATLATLLQASALRPDLVPAIVEAARRVFDPRKLRAGHSYKVVRSALTGFRHLEALVHDILHYLWDNAARAHPQRDRVRGRMRFGLDYVGVKA